MSLIKLVTMKVSQESWPAKFEIFFLMSCMLHNTFTKAFKKLRISFQSSLRFTATLKGRYGDFPYTLSPYACTISPIINFPYQSGIFITIDDLHWHIIITQSPYFTLVLIPELYISWVWANVYRYVPIIISYRVFSLP